MARRARAAVLVLIALLGAGCNGDGAGNSPAGPTTAPDGTEGTGTTLPGTEQDPDEGPGGFTVGTCAEVAGFEAGQPIAVESVTPVTCDAAHGQEIFGVLEHPASEDADFPGEETLYGYAADQCLERFEAYVGAPYEQSLLDIAVIQPDEDAWEDGDRAIACSVYHVDFSPLTGSVRGAAT